MKNVNSLKKRRDPWTFGKEVNTNMCILSFPFEGKLQVKKLLFYGADICTSINILLPDFYLKQCSPFKTLKWILLNSYKGTILQRNYWPFHVYFPLLVPYQLKTGSVRGTIGFDDSVYQLCFRVRALSPILFEIGIPNLVCGCILGVSPTIFGSPWPLTSF